MGPEGQRSTGAVLGQWAKWMPVSRASHWVRMLCSQLVQIQIWSLSAWVTSAFVMSFVGCLTPSPSTLHVILPCISFKIPWCSRSKIYCHQDPSFAPEKIRVTTSAGLAALSITLFIFLEHPISIGTISELKGRFGLPSLQWQSYMGLWQSGRGKKNDIPNFKTIH